MTTYISILRGINVSGQKKILMADLKALYQSVGFKDVITYIQSGNVIFSATKISDTQAAKKIETAIEEKYSFNVPVIIRSVDEMKSVIANNPYTKSSKVDVEKLHVTFLGNAPAKDLIDKIGDVNFPPDEFLIDRKEVFLHVPGSYGETKLSNKFFEAKLKVSCTTRNWKTVNKLLELAEGKA